MDKRRGRPSDADIQILDYSIYMKWLDFLYSGIDQSPKKKSWGNASPNFTFQFREVTHFKHIKKSAGYRALKKLKSENIVKKIRGKSTYILADSNRAISYLSQRIKEIPVFRYPSLLRTAKCVFPTCLACSIQNMKIINKTRKQMKKQRKLTILERWLRSAKKRAFVREQISWEDVGKLYCRFMEKEWKEEWPQDVKSIIYSWLKFHEKYPYDNLIGEFYICPECDNWGRASFYQDSGNREIICKKCGLILETIT